MSDAPFNVPVFIARPPLFCATCGAAVEQKLLGPIRREVWCIAPGCAQQHQVITVFDRIVRA